MLQTVLDPATVPGRPSDIRGGIQLAGEGMVRFFTQALSENEQTAVGHFALSHPLTWTPVVDHVARVWQEAIKRFGKIAQVFDRSVLTVLTEAGASI